MPQKNNQKITPRRRFWLVKWTIPALLARYEEDKVIALTTAINGGLAILVICFLGWLVDLPLLFPALGPSTFILFRTPLAPPAAPRNVISGHLLCLIIGYLVYSLVQFATGTEFNLASGSWQILCSASLTLALACLFMVRLSYNHPPACASGLIVAIGGLNYWYNLAHLPGRHHKSPYRLTRTVLETT
jgi:CBS-domain-containing membrane protein